MSQLNVIPGKGQGAAPKTVEQPKIPVPDQLIIDAGSSGKSDNQIDTAASQQSQAGTQASVAETKTVVNTTSDDITRDSQQQRSVVDNVQEQGNGQQSGLIPNINVDEIGNQSSVSQETLDQDNEKMQSPDIDIDIPDIFARPMSYSSPIHKSEDIELSAQNYLEKEEARKKKNKAENTSNVSSDETPIDREPKNRKKEKKDLPPQNKVGANKFSRAAKRAKDDAVSSVANKMFSGIAVYGKILGNGSSIIGTETEGMRPLAMREISIGTDELVEILAQPRNKLLKTIEEQAKVQLDPNSPTLLLDIINVINDKKNNIVVYTSKSPVNRGSSAQNRILRIHFGRGIYLNPIMAKQYNADFDGDDVVISFKRKSSTYLRDPMAYLIDIDGNVSIDPDFIRPPKLTGRFADESGAMDYIRSVVLKKRNRFDKDILARAILDYSENPNDETLGNMAKAINEVCEKYKSKKYVVMDDILSEIYRGFHKLRMIQGEMIARQNGMATETHMPIPNLTSADKLLVDIVDGLIDGEAPPSFAAFKVLSNMYLGEGDKGQNIAFRITADIAKMYRIDSRISIGSEAEYDDFIDKLMDFSASKRISREAYRAEDVKNASEILRDMVLSRVGFPDGTTTDANGNIVPMYASFKDFLRAFKDAYQEESMTINMANAEFMWNMRIKENRAVVEINGDTIGDLVAPFLNIYGDFEMERIFKGFVGFKIKNKETHVSERTGKLSINHVYGSRSLRDFSHMNRLRVNQKSFNEMKDKKYDSDNCESYLVHAIADVKTSAASKFNIEMYGKSKDQEVDKDANEDDPIVSKMQKVLEKINETLKNDSIGNKESYINDLVEILYLSGSDVFSHYGMDNTRGFLKSKYGKLMLKAKNESELGSIRMAMIAEYRLSKLNNESMNKDELVKEEQPSHVIMKAENRITKELDELRSSSYLWSAIIKDMRDIETSAYKALADGAPSGMVLNAPDYWSNPKHDNVVDMLLDVSVPKEEKELILSDVTRYQEDYYYINGWEMGYQLEMDKSPVWSDLPQTSKSMFNVVSDFNGRFNDFEAKTYQKMYEEVENARKHSEPGDLMTTLDFLSDSSTLIEVDDGIFADALLASLNKVYRQSEKSGQNPAVNGLYNALYYQRNGTLNHDVYRTDDRAIGLVAWDNISIVDVVKVLADPEFTLTVYDKFGNTSIVSRDSLCGKINANEDDIWDLLMRNPRLAHAIRFHNVSIESGSHGDARIFATCSFSETIKRCANGLFDIEINKGKMILMDQPGFGALVSMFKEKPAIDGEKPDTYIARNIRNTYIKNTDIIARMLINEAYSRKIGKGISTNAFVKYRLGLTKEKLESVAPWKDDGTKAYTLIIKIVNDALSSLVENDISEVIRGDFSINGEIDAESISQFFDVRQELNGAKTHTSTSVEGTESHQLAVWMALLSPQDEFTIPEMVTDEELQSEFGECFVIGDNVMRKVNEMSVEEIRKLSENNEIVIGVPAGYKVKDKTTDNYGQQVSSVGAYLILKRDNGAEAYNLKIKKYGDDGSNSITKHSKYLPDVNFNSISKKIKDIAKGPDGVLGAKFWLAKYLKQVNEDLGYDDQDIGNYMCIADVMVLQTDDGNVYLRSLEQIASAIKYRISPELIESGDVDGIKEMSKDIVKEVGTIKGYPNDLSGVHMAPQRTKLIDIGMKRIDSYGNETPDLISQYEIDYSTNMYASSFGRNYDLLKMIKHEFVENGGKVLTNDQIKANKKRIFSKYPEIKDAVKSIKSIKGYELSGVVGTNMCYENIGPQTLWILDSSVDEFDQYLAAEQLNIAEKLGITVFVTDDSVRYNESHKKYLKDMIPMYSDHNRVTGYNLEGYLIPFFDMRLNGSNTYPATGNMAVFRAPRDRVVLSYEDSLNEYNLGDSSIQIFDNLKDRLSVNWSDSSTVMVRDLFPNVFANYPNAKIEVGYVEPKNIEKYIVNEYPEGYYLDYGVAETSSDFEMRKERVDAAIQKYRDNYQSADERGIIRSGNPGDIATFVQVKITGPGVSNGPIVCYAPVIPFELKNGYRVPSRYFIDDISMGIGNHKSVTAFTVNWTFNDTLDGHYVKMYEGAGAANKSMGTLESIEGLPLSNGMYLDYAVAEETTKSRRGGTNKRIRTMETVMYLLRCDNIGYNFADVPESFPNNPDVKEKLSQERITIEEWESLINDDIVFHPDKKMNTFITSQVKKFMNIGGNPSDYLACRFGTQYSDVFWEFRNMFSIGHEYEEALLKYLHLMRPDMVPDGLNYDDTSAMFRVSRENGYNRNCLQCKIPHRSAENPNEVWYSYENLYAGFSFFGEEFSGFNKPNVNGASISMEVLNTMALQGASIRDEDIIKQLKFACSDIGRIREVADIQIDWSKLYNENNADIDEQDK